MGSLGLALRDYTFKRIERYHSPAVSDRKCEAYQIQEGFDYPYFKDAAG